MRAIGGRGSWSSREYIVTLRIRVRGSDSDSSSSSSSRAAAAAAAAAANSTPPPPLGSTQRERRGGRATLDIVPLGGPGTSARSTQCLGWQSPCPTADHRGAYQPTGRPPAPIGMAAPHPGPQRAAMPMGDAGTPPTRRRSRRPGLKTAMLRWKPPTTHLHARRVHHNLPTSPETGGNPAHNADWRAGTPATTIRRLAKRSSASSLPCPPVPKRAAGANQEAEQKADVESSPQSPAFPGRFQVRVAYLRAGTPVIIGQTRRVPPQTMVGRHRSSVSAQALAQHRFETARPSQCGPSADPVLDSNSYHAPCCCLP